MRVRNLMVKPSSARGNDMIKVRWLARISDGDGHFTLNTGSNEGTTGKTEFDILANQDTNIGASQSNANIDRVTKLPDCRLCLALKATALVDMTVNILTARQKDKSIWLPGKKREFAMAAGRTSILSAEISHVQGIRDSFSVRPVLANVQPQGTDVLHVNDMTLVTGEEKEIMDLLDVGAFTALTAPYAAVPAGGVFLLALVILTGGWPHENTESMDGPALRKPGQHLERDTGICHQSEERRPLGIHPSQGRSLHPEAEVRMHDDTAQPAQLMGPHTTGAGGYAAPGEWASRHGHHQRRSKGCYWHPYGCRYQDHGDWHVRRRVGRVADFAGGWRSYLRSRHRTLLNDGLGVAA